LNSLCSYLCSGVWIKNSPANHTRQIFQAIHQTVKCMVWSVNFEDYTFNSTTSRCHELGKQCSSHHIKFTQIQVERDKPLTGPARIDLWNYSWHCSFSTISCKTIIIKTNVSTEFLARSVLITYWSNKAQWVKPDPVEWTERLSGNKESLACGGSHLQGKIVACQGKLSEWCITLCLQLKAHRRHVSWPWPSRFRTGLWWRFSSYSFPNCSYKCFLLVCLALFTSRRWLAKRFPRDWSFVQVQLQTEFTRWVQDQEGQWAMHDWWNWRYAFQGCHCYCGSGVSRLTQAPRIMRKTLIYGYQNTEMHHRIKRSREGPEDRMH